MVCDAGEGVRSGEGFDFFEEDRAVEGQGEVLGDRFVELLALKKVGVVGLADEFEDADDYLGGAEGDGGDGSGGEVAVQGFDFESEGVEVGAFDPGGLAGHDDLLAEKIGGFFGAEGVEALGADAVDAGIGDQFEFLGFGLAGPEHDGGEVEGSDNGVGGHHREGMKGLVHRQRLADAAEGVDFFFGVAEGEIGFAEFVDVEDEDGDVAVFVAGGEVGVSHGQSGLALNDGALDEVGERLFLAGEEVAGDAPGTVEFTGFTEHSEAGFVFGEMAQEGGFLEPEGEVFTLGGRHDVGEARGF